MLEQTKEDVENFLNLYPKTEVELKAICEGMKLAVDGSKDDLIRRLMSDTKIIQQADITQPQAIPLRTRDIVGNPLEEATLVLKNWRSLINRGTKNIKKFQLLSKRNKEYSLDLRYATCKTETLQTILDKNWFLAQPHQKDLIRLLKTCPEKFVCNIIQKPDIKGQQWIMLHVSVRKEK